MDAMNVDWCLTCNRQTTHGKPYCSRPCKLRAADAADEYTGQFGYVSDDASSSSDAFRDPFLVHHQQRPQPSSKRHTHPSSSGLQQDQCSTRPSYTRHHAPQQQFLDSERAASLKWQGYNEAGIRAWARAIPAGSSSVETPSIGPSNTCARPDFPLSRQRPAGPALCTDTTQVARTTARSSSPISLPSPHASEAHAHASYSMSSQSLVSALTESIFTPESAHPHTKAQIHAANGSSRPGVFDGLARRFRSWGTNTGAPALKHDAPVEIFMRTTTTTVTASPSPSSPTSPVQRKENSKGSASAFTVRGDCADTDCDDEREQHQERAVFDLRLPLASVRSPLTIGDAELKESLVAGLRGAGGEQHKRGVWIAGREKADKGWAGFGPAYYEKNYRALGPVSIDERNDREREFREHEAWRARGRKTVRR